MTKKYMVRVDKEDIDRLKNMRNMIQFDINKATGKNIKLPIGTVVKIAINPNFNENYIQTDLKKLAKLFGRKYGR